jgi:hypothetical protein
LTSQDLPASLFRCCILLLLLHSFKQLEIKNAITDRLMTNIIHTGLFNNQYTSKLLAIGLLVTSLGAKGKKEKKLIGEV